MKEIDRPCELGDCKGEGVRHFAGHYFCNECRNTVVLLAKMEQVESLFDWIETVVE